MNFMKLFVIDIWTIWIKNVDVYNSSMPLQNCVLCYWSVVRSNKVYVILSQIIYNSSCLYNINTLVYKPQSLCMLLSMDAWEFPLKRKFNLFFK